MINISDANTTKSIQVLNVILNIFLLDLMSYQTAAPAVLRHQFGHS